MPDRPYEVSVTVRLEDEAGAAGLVFASDGDQKHYGFYPSAGQLRLTRFDGPDVYSWTVLKQVPSPHYRLGDWNTLRVRCEKEKIFCFVNDQLRCYEIELGALDSPPVARLHLQGCKVRIRTRTRRCMADDRRLDVHGCHDFILADFAFWFRAEQSAGLISQNSSLTASG